MTHRVLLAIALMLPVCVFSLEAGPPRAVPHPAVPHRVPNPVPHPVPPPIRPPLPPRLPQPPAIPQMQKAMGQMQKELNQFPKGLKDGMDQLRNGKFPAGAGDLLKGVQHGAKGRCDEGTAPGSPQARTCNPGQIAQAIPIAPQGKGLRSLVFQAPWASASRAPLAVGLLPSDRRCGGAGRGRPKRQQARRIERG